MLGLERNTALCDVTKLRKREKTMKKQKKKKEGKNGFLNLVEFSEKVEIQLHNVKKKTCKSEF